MREPYDRVKEAEKGAYLSFFIYLLLSTIKIFISLKWNSSALRADGLNNLTDVASSIAVIIGLRTARKPADDDHRYGHWKAEPIASLITSFIMMIVGLQVLYSSGLRIVRQEFSIPNLIAGWTALVSALILFAVYRYNNQLSNKIKSSGLKAVSKDNLSDALTSSATGIAIFASSAGLGWVDGVMAFIVGLIILKTSVDVFKESAFSLSDGFDIDEITYYKKAILSVNGVKGIKTIKGRMYGANVYLDVTILVRANMTVQEGHDITRDVQKYLYTEYEVMDIDVHVEPAAPAIILK